MEEVAADMRDGLISRAAARSEYGVVFDDDLRVDQAATAALRAREDVQPDDLSSDAPAGYPRLKLDIGSGENG